MAALLVVFGHAQDFGLPSIVDGSASHYGVLIFFALSGFLMGDLYLTKTPTIDRLMAYAVARFARIVPIYYLVVCVAFMIHRVDPGFAYAVTPLQLIRLLTFNGSTSVFWSIGPEVQFYVIFTALWILHGRYRGDGIFALVVLFLTGLCFLTIRVWPGVFVASKFHIFALGMLAALLHCPLKGRLQPAAVALGHVAACAVLALFLVPGLSEALLGATPFDRQADPAFTRFYGSILRVLLAAYLALALSFQSRFATPVFGNRAAGMLGRCSFSIYLLHVAIYDIATRSGLTAALPPLLGTLTVVAATIASSLATYRWIEAPARRRLRSRLHDADHRQHARIEEHIPT